ncbi:sensor histidine kinase [Catenuloplanes japonicus]|uniref:sensor histidine kinase n=1 Tax=Catenuloplanes japonicus TaxID=33876 RepID=UPI000AB53C10|nr:histidine kinase [Catenuloplanes japonicus]
MKVIAIGRLTLAVVLGLGLLLEIAVTISAHSPLGIFSVAATAGVCAAAMLRRWAPGIAVAVAVGLVLAMEFVDAGEAPAPIACLAMLIVVGTAVRRLRLGGAVLAWAGGALPALMAQTSYTSTVALVMLVGWAVAVGAGAWARVGDARRRDLRESVRRSERVALARDLHDVAAHHLTALIIQAQAGQVGPGDSRAVLGEIEAAGVEALNSLRRLARLLRDEEETEAGPGTVAELVAAFGRRGLLEADLAGETGTGVGYSGDRSEGSGASSAAADPMSGAATPTAAGPPGAGGMAPGVTALDAVVPRVAVPGVTASEGIGALLELPDGPQPEDWPPEVATGLYRIAQEALTNVVRHAPDARHVTVTLTHDTRAICLTVTDDGGGTGRAARADRQDSAPASGKGAGRSVDGLRAGRGVDGMRERAAGLGGTLTAGPTAHGWTVRAVIPAPASSRGRSWRIWR